MDEHSGKGCLWTAGAVWVWVVVCIFQYSTFATGYYSFGKSVNLSFGADYTKTMLKKDIFDFKSYMEILYWAYLDHQLHSILRLF